MDFSVDSLEGDAKQHGSFAPTPGKRRVTPAAILSPIASPTPSSRISKNATPTSDDDGKGAFVLKPQACREQGETVSLQLSPWERWMVKKTREEREKLVQRKEKQEEQKRKDIERSKKEAEKREKALQEYQRWGEQKLMKQKKEKTQQVKSKREEEEEERKHRLKQRSKQAFQDWCRMKREEEECERRKVEDKLRKQVQLAQQKKERAEKAYRAWLERARCVTPPPFASSHLNSTASCEQRHS